jgi:hypothetical protein
VINDGKTKCISMVRESLYKTFCAVVLHVAKVNSGS